jgi:hypothetical protein
MPVHLNKIASCTECEAFRIVIDDELKLSEFVARVLVGHARWVSYVLKELHSGFTIASSKNQRKSAKNILLNNIPDHRDGLIYQIISWIALHKTEGHSIIIRFPHLIPAHKGFDGIHLHLNNESTEIIKVIVSEEKATKNPRDTVRNKIWPEFNDLERGDRDNQLMQEVCSLINSSDIVNVEEAISKIIWNQVKGYRASITISDDHKADIRIKDLFEGYKNIIPGSIWKRRGDVLYFQDLRDWMNKFAKKVLTSIDAIEESNV